jgi:hypothetical protein
VRTEDGLDLRAMHIGVVNGLGHRGYGQRGPVRIAQLAVRQARIIRERLPERVQLADVLGDLVKGDGARSTWSMVRLRQIGSPYR